MPAPTDPELLWLAEQQSETGEAVLVLVHVQTPFQTLLIIETPEQGKALILDGMQQSATCDEFIYHELLVHPAMLAHGAPRKVLILGGGEGATAREALRWRSVERVLTVDLDAEVVAACRAHLPEMHQGSFEDPRHELLIADAQDYLEGCEEQWDVVIFDLCDPTDEGPSASLFSAEFFALARGVLAEGGQFAAQAGPVAPPALELHARLSATLRGCFASAQNYHGEVPSFGGEWGFIRATDVLDTDPRASSDERFPPELCGALRYLDAERLAASERLPAYLQTALAKEAAHPYTILDPANISSRGS